MNIEDDSPLSEIETMIIMSLDANNTISNSAGSLRDNNGGVFVISDQGDLLGFDNMLPKSAITYDISDDRLFTTHPDYLLAHQSEILGDEAEVVMFAGGIMKWRGFRRLKKAPKGVATIGKVSHWYEMHQRFTGMNGFTQYFKRAIPISASGKILPASIQGQWVCGPKDEGIVLNLCCSVIEDSQRSGVMVASVKESTEIKFPVPIADYKDVFIGRDGPLLQSGRRKAIIHWVASHLRSRQKGNTTEVKRHIRGVQSFVIDGLSVVIEPSRFDAREASA